MTSQVEREVEKTKAKQITWLDHTFRDREGNIVIIHPPNLPILVGITATLLHFVLPNAAMQTTFGLIGFGALFTWAWQELFTGVNYFRRSLGLLGLVGLMAGGLNLIGM